MRKTVDTLLLILLLIGPAVILTCVRQPSEEEEKTTTIDKITTLETTSDSLTLYADFSLPRP